VRTGNGHVTQSTRKGIDPEQSVTEDILDGERTTTRTKDALYSKTSVRFIDHTSTTTTTTTVRLAYTPTSWNLSALDDVSYRTDPGQRWRTPADEATTAPRG